MAPKALDQLSYRRRSVIWAVGAVGLLVLATESMAAGPSLQDGSIADKVAQMKPGEFLWAPEVAPEGPVLIIVSLETQRAYAYRNGVPIGISTVSTGKAGHVTPTGVFTVLQKQIDHKSNLYNDAPMPFMQRLTWDGIAMHAGKLPGYRASHGCIRLPLAFAKLLYGVTRLGLTVVITDKAQVPRVAPTPSILMENPVLSSDATPGAIVWQPEKSSEGPLSIVISSADRRLIVLRNGVVIGSASVTIAGEVTGPSAYTLRAIDPGGYHWLQLALPGQALGGAELSAQERNRLSLPEDFRRSLAAVLTPGATVVVTPDTLRGANTGKPIKVLTGENG
jgi:hypothetical protein